MTAPQQQAAPPRRRFNAGLAAVGMMYNQAVTVLSGVLIGRIVGAADYGIANVAKNLFQIAVLVTPMGLDLALQRYMSAGRHLEEHPRAVLSLLRLLAFALALVPVVALALGLGDWLEAHAYRYRQFAWVLLVTFAALPFGTDAAVTGGAYRGMRAPGAAVLATYVLQPTFRVLLIVVLFLLGWRLWAIVAATTIAAVLSWFYVFVRARRDFPPTPVPRRAAWGAARGVLGYSWVMGVSLVVAMITKSVDVLVLGHYRPSAEVGRYVAVQLLTTLLTLFSAALGQTLPSRVAELFEKSDFAGVERVIGDNIRAISLVAAPIFAAIVLWGDRIDLILGRSFIVDWQVVLLLATTQWAIAAFNFAGMGLSMTGRQSVEAWILVLGLTATVVLCLLLVPVFGQRGAAFGTLVAFGGTNLLRVVVVRRLFGVRLFRWRILTPLVVALAAGAAVRLALDPIDPRTFLSTAGAATLAVLLYGAAIWRLLSAEERALARTAVTKLVKRQA